MVELVKLFNWTYVSVIYEESSYGMQVSTFLKERYVGTVHCKYMSTVNPDLSGHSKNSITKVLNTNSSLMKVESIAESSLGVFCNTFDLH